MGKLKFPPPYKKETKVEYVKRLINYSSIAEHYHNRRDRKKAIEEHWDSVPYKYRNSLISEEKYLFLIDACRYLGIARQTMYWWVRKGYIKPGYVVRGKTRYMIFEIAVLDEIKRIRYETKLAKQKSDSN